jgi:hypothetical protein
MADSSLPPTTSDVESPFPQKSCITASVDNFLLAPTVDLSTGMIVLVAKEAPPLARCFLSPPTSRHLPLDVPGVFVGTE